MRNKRNEKESMICLTPKPSQSFLDFKGLNKKLKEGFLISFAMVIKKNPTMSIRKHTNKLKVHEKTVRSVIKQDLSPDFNTFDYAI